MALSHELVQRLKEASGNLPQQGAVVDQPQLHEGTSDAAHTRHNGRQRSGNDQVNTNGGQPQPTTPFQPRRPHRPVVDAAARVQRTPPADTQAYGDAGTGNGVGRENTQATQPGDVVPYTAPSLPTFIRGGAERVRRRVRGGFREVTDDPELAGQSRRARGLLKSLTPDGRRRNEESKQLSEIVTADTARWQEIRYFISGLYSENGQDIPERARSLLSRERREPVLHNAVDHAAEQLGEEPRVLIIGGGHDKTLPFGMSRFTHHMDFMGPDTLLTDDEIAQSQQLLGDNYHLAKVTVSELADKAINHPEAFYTGVVGERVDDEMVFADQDIPVPDALRYDLVVVMGSAEPEDVEFVYDFLQPDGQIIISADSSNDAFREAVISQRPYPLKMLEFEAHVTADAFPAEGYTNVTSHSDGRRVLTLQGIDEETYAQLVPPDTDNAANKSRRSRRAHTGAATNIFVAGLITTAALSVGMSGDSGTRPLVTDCGPGQIPIAAASFGNHGQESNFQISGREITLDAEPNGDYSLITPGPDGKMKNYGTFPSGQTAFYIGGEPYSIAGHGYRTFICGKP